ncbi:MAG: DUF6338 family protein [Solirubrobacterales bacterium]
MIPSSILGVALVAAALGPGYVYVRLARKKMPRGSQSQVGELVEMLVIGALFSVVAAGIVLSFSKASGFLDTNALADDFNSYLLTEPARSFTCLVAFYGLAYMAAWAVAALRHRGENDFKPDGSAWYQAFANGCPADSVPFLTVELNDGRWIAGAYKKATVERDENRELCLQRPLGIAAKAGAPMEDEPHDDFVLLREKEIRQIKGRYMKRFPTQGGSSAKVIRRDRDA